MGVKPVNLLDKFAHYRDAFLWLFQLFLWLFQLQKVRRFRQEIVAPHLFASNVTGMLNPVTRYLWRNCSRR